MSFAPAALRVIRRARSAIKEKETEDSGPGPSTLFSTEVTQRCHPERARAARERRTCCHAECSGDCVVARRARARDPLSGRTSGAGRKQVLRAFGAQDDSAARLR